MPDNTPTAGRVEDLSPDCAEFYRLRGLVVARRVRRAVAEYRRSTRRVGGASDQNVSRIAGEPILADLSERTFAKAGLLMARLRLAGHVEDLAWELRQFVDRQES